jgi:hypothetical protein
MSYEDTQSHLAVDFVECHHGSANFKQVWFALAALAILQLLIFSTMGTITER